MYLNKNQKKNTVFPTLSVSAVVHFYYFSTVHIKDKKKTSEYDQEIPQSHTADHRLPDIIIHFIKQRDQFHFERKLYVQKCVPVLSTFCPQ